MLDRAVKVCKLHCLVTTWIYISMIPCKARLNACRRALSVKKEIRSGYSDVMTYDLDIYPFRTLTAKLNRLYHVLNIR